mmetsp:Transcript_47876/g.94459  ORF Transcript_47876/g.94459 Transcript_47876/m.94459 type:complete len:201 (-) Transcript_47876:425-1027(-)
MSLFLCFCLWTLFPAFLQRLAQPLHLFPRFHLFIQNPQTRRGGHSSFPAETSRNSGDALRQLTPVDRGVNPRLSEELLVQPVRLPRLVGNRKEFDLHRHAVVGPNVHSPVSLEKSLLLLRLRHNENGNVHIPIDQFKLHAASCAGIHVNGLAPVFSHQIEPTHGNRHHRCAFQGAAPSLREVASVSVSVAVDAPLCRAIV